MTNAEKCRAIAKLFDDGRESDAWLAMEHMLSMREWPAWLDQAAREIDVLCDLKNKPIQEPSL